MGQGDSKWDPTWGRARSGHGRPPFGDTVITAWHLDRPATEQALEAIEWEVLRARRSGALVAPAGTGRTHLLRVVGDWINRVQWESVYLPNPMLDLEGVCRLALGLDAAAGASAGSNVMAAFERRLEALWGEGRSLLLLVDDAEHMPEETVHALLDLAERHSPTLVVLFAAESEAAVEHAFFGEDRAGFPVVSVEAPLDEAEAHAYLLHRLERSGTSRELAARFTEEVTARLYAMSGGVASRLHALAQVLVETPAEAPEEAWARFLLDERGILDLVEGSEEGGDAPAEPTEAEAREAALRASVPVEEALEREPAGEVDPLLAGADVERAGPLRVTPEEASRRRAARARRRRQAGR